MPRQSDYDDSAAQIDPNDPLAPRPDEPRIGGGWARRLSGRLSGRPAGRSRFYGRPATIIWMVLLIAMVALGVVLLVPIL
jgi:hypothetical protein